VPVNKAAYHQLQSELKDKDITLVAVSKTKSVKEIKELYDLGQRDFGENYVQELVEKARQLPGDIRWHFIGHLQTNKVKQIVPFIQLIQSVDSLKLLKEISKQAGKIQRTVNCLLQIHIAEEETKFGLDEPELDKLLTEVKSHEKEFKWISIKGVMAMASLTDDMNKVRSEFSHLKAIFKRLTTSDYRLMTLSMGMSADYKIAMEEGSNLIRIGSLLFGERP
jgi:pyridoxal phosphate enzyme (YggS family)